MGTEGFVGVDEFPGSSEGGGGVSDHEGVSWRVFCLGGLDEDEVSREGRWKRRRRLGRGLGAVCHIGCLDGRIIDREVRTVGKISCELYFCSCEAGFSDPVVQNGCGSG